MGVRNVHTYSTWYTQDEPMLRVLLASSGIAYPMLHIKHILNYNNLKSGVQVQFSICCKFEVLSNFITDGSRLHLCKG